MFRKVTLVLCFLLFIVGISDLTSQTDTISLHVKKVPLGEVLIQIEKVTDFRFFYSNDKINLEKEFSGEFTAVPLVKILNKIFKGTRIDYKIFGNQILLIPS